MNHSDLPPAILRLARRLARDCKSPGTYTITLTVEANPRHTLTADIAKLLPIATIDGSRRKPKPLNNR